jgi:hypothetical protein
MNTPPRTLPRRANTIRALAASMAAERRSLEAARQAISDRIGYAVAALIGVGAYRYFGRQGVEALVALYAVSVVMSYRRLRRMAPK